LNVRASGPNTGLASELREPRNSRLKSIWVFAG
jgi:hypothetical protein